MKCSEIIRMLRELAPEECACEWDNPGLLAGRSGKEVKTIYIALDATDQVVEAAAGAGADLLITHHPLIFKAIKQVNDQNFITTRLVKLIQADISYYVMHTNFDAAPGCMADLAAKRLGIAGGVPLEAMGEVEGENGPVPYGIGKTGTLSAPVTVRELAKRVREAFGLSFAIVYGQELLDTQITRVSVCPGSGGSEIEAAILNGSQVFVTGDIGHHQGIDAAARGMAVIDGGHYGLEHIFISYMADWLGARLGGEVKVIQSPPAWPSVIV